ncbi:hypothetical protein MHPYR_260047 [uncultured Mycobacterium sp.]|uniref:Uncharacterized protein n=1 Tax=uncultured Mycobacterium sp. TaxID=171292 RepID=A0A1Y5PE38_9MYCO|nr:hypothetical protein MHPYR_240010 [uncultured Mycobacterium sp.]SBS75720.1 hypothetical protein MHPYR_260047 [uncultured Mycobacterium sp.]
MCIVTPVSTRTINTGIDPHGVFTGQATQRNLDYPPHALPSPLLSENAPTEADDMVNFRHDLVALDKALLVCDVCRTTSR